MSSEQFTEPVEKIFHSAREETVKKVYTAFDPARSAQNMGGILLVVEKVQNYFADVVRMMATSFYFSDFSGLSPKT